jgi:hypothetical protein
MTQRAFAKLAQMFKRDQGVILEPLNEPHSPIKHSNGWQLWLNGGVVDGVTYVGVNQLIKTARDVGAGNLIILQGIGGTFRDYPGGVTDPKNRFAYSVHPFFKNGATETDWSANFGNLAIAKPVILTAWNADPRESWCTSSSLDLPRRFVKYIRVRGVGVIGYGFDFRGTIVRDFRGLPTQWPSQCGQSGGPGELLKAYYVSSP